MAVPVLDAFIDESSDQKRTEVFCVAGFLAHEHFWKTLEVQWVRRLRDDGVRYFRSSDCKAVRGAFEHLRIEHGSLAAAKTVADALRKDLEDILTSPQSHWHGFSLGVVVSEYDYVLNTYPESRHFYARDPTVAAYSQIMYEIVRTVRRKAKKFGVGYIVDDSTYSEKIKHAFNAMKIHHPTVGSSAKICTSSDDKLTPALQMADLLVSVTKDFFMDWLTSGKKQPDVGTWYGHLEPIGKWDANHMLRSLTRTLKSRRLLEGTLVRQFVPSPRLTKGQRKRQRRKMWKDSGA